MFKTKKHKHSLGILFRIFNFLTAREFQSGQVMLFSVLIMGAIMAAAMAVSLVMINEVRLARQIPYAAKAIAAADAGMECAFFEYHVDNNRTCEAELCSGTLDNGATFVSRLRCRAGVPSMIHSVGAFMGVRRALDIDLIAPPPTP